MMKTNKEIKWKLIDEEKPELYLAEIPLNYDDGDIKIDKIKCELYFDTKKKEVLISLGESCSYPKVKFVRVKVGKKDKISLGEWD